MEKWSILRTTPDYVDHNKISLPSNRMNFNPPERKCLKGYRQLNVKGKT